MLVVRASTFTTRVGVLRLGCAQCRQHGRQNDSRTEAGFAESGFIFLDHAGERDGSDYADAIVRLLRVVGNLGLIDIKRQRFFQPKSNHALGFFGIVREGIEFEQSHAHGGVGQDRDHIVGAAGYAGDGRLQGRDDGIGLAQIALDQVRDHATWREFAGGAGFDGCGHLRTGGRLTHGRRRFHTPAWVLDYCCQNSFSEFNSF